MKILLQSAVGFHLLDEQILNTVPKSAKSPSVSTPGQVCGPLFIVKVSSLGLGAVWVPVGRSIQDTGLFSMALGLCYT